MDVVLRKSRILGTYQLVGKMDIPSFAYRPTIKSRVEIPTPYQYGKYSSNGRSGVIGINSIRDFLINQEK